MQYIPVNLKVLTTHLRLSNEKRMDTEIPDTSFSKPNRLLLDNESTKSVKNQFKKGDVTKRR